MQHQLCIILKFNLCTQINLMLMSSCETTNHNKHDMTAQLKPLLSPSDIIPSIFFSYYSRHGGYVFDLVCQQDYGQTTGPIFIKLGGKV